MEGNRSMKGAVLPGNSTVELRDFEIPKPGHGEVLIQTKATTICGSDIRCIYREHVGKGPEGCIPATIAGHEPCGVIVEEGEGLRRFHKGDRVIVYYISGCGLCNDCRRGYYISCKKPLLPGIWLAAQRRHGPPTSWRRKRDLIALPDSLTYKDGAQVACGFGTVYEAIEKIGVSGKRRRAGNRLGPCRSGGPDALPGHGRQSAHWRGDQRSPDRAGQKAGACGSCVLSRGGAGKGSAAHGRKRRGAPIDASASDPAGSWPSGRRGIGEKSPS